MKIRYFPVWIAVAGLSSLATVAGAHPVQITPDVVAVTDDEANDEAGLPTDTYYDWFNDIVINANRDIAVRAGLRWSDGTLTDAVDTNNDSGLWFAPYPYGTGSLVAVARESQEAPDETGAPSGALFKELIGSGANPAIADDGQVVFRSRLFIGEVFVEGVSVGNSTATIYTDFGLWSHDPNTAQTRLIVRQQDAVPDDPTSKFSLKRTLPVINYANGNVAFYSTLFVNQAGSLATSYDNAGIWFWENSSGTLAKVARTDALWDGDDEAPLGGITDKCFSGFLLAPVLGTHADDPLAFAGVLRSEPKYDGNGDPVPDRVTSKNRRGIWAGTWDDMLQEFESDISVRAGDDANFSGLLFKTLRPPDINAGKDIAFRGGLFGAPPQNEGIWIKLATSTSVEPPVAIRGNTAAPGMAAPTTFRKFYFDPLICDTRDVVFAAAGNYVSGLIDKDNDTGIWKKLWGGALIAVAVEGANAPDYTPGVDLKLASDPATAVQFAAFERPSLNQNGQVAFKARIKRQPIGLTAVENEGIWAQRTSGDLQLVVVEGDEILVDAGPPAVYKKVVAVRMVSGSGGSDGRPRGWVYDSLAGKGRLAFIATFDDGTSGAFVATVD